MADVEARAVMDDCIDTIKKGDARTSLLSSDNEQVIGSEVTSEKPRDLEVIMDLLQHNEERVAHDNRKFILNRDGTMSYVYLASVKSM